MSYVRRWNFLEKLTLGVPGWPAGPGLGWDGWPQYWMIASGGVVRVEDSVVLRSYATMCDCSPLGVLCYNVCFFPIRCSDVGGAMLQRVV